MSKHKKMMNKGGGLTELKHRLLFVLLGVIVFRLGSYIPVPGIDPSGLQQFFNAQDSTILGMFNMFSGGALSRFTIFALGVMPYISASIIFQLLSQVNPTLEELRKEGEAGRRKITQYTRYATFALALFQSFGIAKFMASQGLVLAGISPFMYYLSAVVTLTTGSMFLMWVGEQMTERGVGNGISMLIFAGIVAGLPTAIVHTLEQTQRGDLSLVVLLFIVILVLAVTSFVVYMERAQRRITVNYAKRQQGRKMYAPQTSHLPLKINMAGVIPPIFASSILLFPATIGQWFGSSTEGLTWLGKVGLALAPGQPLYLVVFSVAIIFFCFFYTALVFNPKETADNLKKSGAFIPGIRPGEQTAKYIDATMSRLTLVGSVYITAVCLLPLILMQFWNVPFYFGGTSLLIVVVVIMDFIAQVQSHMMSTKYDSLLKKANLTSFGR
ncbi:preprotein translocase subunit SecY [Thiotrichales bacterium 19S11-10]|nr:preprotein translocase subunit SecY [Thiotrichales bacterium 19S11-10]MCF6807616.1 preprotein translocase subunit SecY [Thiotrichales bacterium 19S9-11]MCF6811585.1 preprotein translocase subunit SecY [Thiotrichales bacterium 19S9-12]